MRGLLLLSALPVTFLASCGEVLNGVTALSHSHWPFHSNQQSRYKFLSSSAAVCFTAAASVLGGDPKTCNAIEHAELMALAGKEIPRYIDYTLLMKYGYGPDGNQRTRGVLVRRYTGDSTPYSFPVSPVPLVKEWPKTMPFEAEDFIRSDTSDDKWFYAVPRLVYHIDEPAVAALTQYYRKNILPGSSILDICSSWVSHYPLEFPKTMSRISGTGISSLELLANDQLSDYQAKNLNEDIKLPYDDETFDVVTCVVSIDYLTHPIRVLREVQRVLKPGGKVIISQSNRCFPSKAVSIWLRLNDRQRLELINAYFQYAGGFGPRKAFDITAGGPGSSSFDPMFIVEAVKVSNEISGK